MCLAVPAKILSFDESNSNIRMGKVDYGGAITDVCMEWLPEANVGDYVLVHVGTALSIVDESDALETIEALKEMGEI
ncbi:MAG: HypC/HybG/HupF family hydrogenase formation chaperone [Bacteroidetes bacterium HGW-Bacteroidetes-17]|jgi:hydrogenase expression/formation protein HypC|nr:MAG: HypC/HybG/HupF family hydrogenase formation chaperone [Bacteroidetes bacterium HGW-Bacteroidetes-17]